jgi:cell shape-determining protein MreC
MDERRFRLYVSIILGIFVFTGIRVALNSNPIYDAGEPVFNWLNEFSDDIALVRSQDQNQSQSLQSQNQALEAENEQLRTELNLKTERQTISAEVTRRNLLEFKKQVWVNVGKDDGISVGQTVLHQDSLFGLVTETYDRSAIVTTVLDPDFRATVVVGEEQGVVKIEYGSVIVDLVPSKTLSDQAIISDGLDGRVEANIFIGTSGGQIAGDSDVFGQYNILLPYNIFDVQFVDIVQSEATQ